MARSTGFEDRLPSAFPGQRDAETATEFFPEGLVQPRFPAGRGHAPDAASPLLDQAQFVEDPPDHPVAQLGDAAADVVDGEAEEKQGRLLHFQAVVEDGDADRTAPLGVVGVDDGVDDGFPQCCGREGPAIDSAHLADDRLPGGVAAHEGDGLVDGWYRQAPDFGAVENPAAVGALETSGLDPGVGEVAFPVPAEEQDAADGGHIVAPVQPPVPAA